VYELRVLLSVVCCASDRLIIPLAWEWLTGRAAT
jgi:hypothetical protein